MLPRAYIGKLCPGYSHNPILNPNLGRIRKESRIFMERAFDVLKEPVFDLVDDVTSADFIMLPHDYFVIEKERDYVDQYVRLAKEHKKKLLIFDFSDFDRAIDISIATIFRVSQYRSSKRSNVIMMPAFAEDLGTHNSVIIKQKSNKPTIGFVGWATFNDSTQWLKYFAKNLLLHGPRRQGVYFRRRAIAILSSDKRIKTNFITRSSFSGHRDTISLNPEIARQEYIDNISNSDFILAPKGDGNCSIRFYEALSLGHIPILIDTETVLPLEDVIDYDKFILRIPWQEIDSIPERVIEFYANLNNEQFVEMQEKAQGAFEQYLRFDKFIKYALDELIL